MTTDHEVQCPMPGTFYRRSSPDAPAYFEPGDSVTVVAFLVDNEGAVEAGQPIVSIRTA